jgi:ABC-2 type transport system permease protein
MTVKTHSHVSSDLRMAACQGLSPARGNGWLAGFNNMLRKELGEWFSTRRWLSQLLIWITILNGLVAIMLFAIPAIASTSPEVSPALEKSFGILSPEVEGVTIFFSMLAMAGIIGVINLAQDEVIQEKQSGTAAWILSKPAARTGFIITKLLANTIGILVFIVAIPALIVQVEIYLTSNQFMPVVPFLTGAGIFVLALFFYLSLVILLGVLFESRRPVMGIAIGVMLGGTIIIQIFPQLTFALPFGMDKIAMLVALGMPIPAMSVAGVIVTVVSSIVFILVALWRFQRIEL